MLATSQCFGRHLCVRIVACSNKHKLRFLIGEYLPIVGCRVGETEPFSRVLCAQPSRGANAGQLERRLFLNNRKQHSSREITGSDEADSELAVWQRLGGFRLLSGVRAA